MKFLIVAAISAVAGYALAENRRLSRDIELSALLAGMTRQLEERNRMSDETLSQLDAIGDRDETAIQGIGVKITDEAGQVRAEIQRLQDAINRGVNRDQLLARVQRFEAIAGRLEGIGQDVENIFTPEAPAEPPAEPAG